MGFKSKVAEHGYSEPAFRGCEFPDIGSGKTRPTMETKRRWKEWEAYQPKQDRGLPKIRIIKKGKIVKEGRIMKMPKSQTGSAYGVTQKPTISRKFVEVQ